MAKAKSDEEKRAALAAKGLSPEAIEKVIAKQAANAAEKVASRKRAEGGEARRPGRVSKKMVEEQAARKEVAAETAALLSSPRRTRRPGPPPGEPGQPAASPEARRAARVRGKARRIGRQYEPVAGTDFVDLSEEGDYKVTTIKTPNVESGVSRQITGVGGEDTIAGQEQRARYMGVSTPEGSALRENDAPLPRRERHFIIRNAVDRAIAAQMAQLPATEELFKSEGSPGPRSRMQPIGTVFQPGEGATPEERAKKGRWLRVSEHPATRGRIISVGYRKDLPTLTEDEKRGSTSPGTFNELGFVPVKGAVVTPPPSTSKATPTGETREVEVADTPFTRARIANLQDPKKYPMATTPVTSTGRIRTRKKGGAASRAVAPPDMTFDPYGTPEIVQLQPVEGSLLSGYRSQIRDINRQSHELTRLLNASAQATGGTVEAERALVNALYNRTSDPYQETLESMGGRPVESELDKAKRGDEAAARAVARQHRLEQLRDRVAADVALVRDSPHHTPPITMRVPQQVFAEDKAREARIAAERAASRAERAAEITRMRGVEAAGEESRKRLEEKLALEATDPEAQRVIRLASSKRNRVTRTVVDMKPHVTNILPTRDISASTPASELRPGESEMVAAVAAGPRVRDARALAYGQPEGTPVKELQGPKPPTPAPSFAMSLGGDPVREAALARAAGLRGTPTLTHVDDQGRHRAGPSRTVVMGSSAVSAREGFQQPSRFEPRRTPYTPGPRHQALIAAQRAGALVRRAEAEQRHADRMGMLSAATGFPVEPSMLRADPTKANEAGFNSRGLRTDPQAVAARQASAIIKPVRRPS